MKPFLNPQEQVVEEANGNVSGENEGSAILNDATMNNEKSSISAKKIFIHVVKHVFTVYDVLLQ